MILIGSVHFGEVHVGLANDIVSSAGMVVEPANIPVTLADDIISSADDFVA